MAGAYDIGFHADRMSGTMELVVKTASLQREYELCMTNVRDEYALVADHLALVVFPPRRCLSGVAVIALCTAYRKNR